MKKLIIMLFAAWGLSLNGVGQSCNCTETFSWLRTTFEQNDAGFQYILDKKGSSSYEIHNLLFLDQVKNAATPIACEAILQEWLRYFRHAHVEFRFTGDRPPEEENSEQEHKLVEHAVNATSLSKFHQRILHAKGPFFERLDSHTLYLRIPSFQGQQKPLIDSLIARHRTTLLQTENLIIDIRNGTGGNDDSYAEIMPLLYTNPIRLPTVEFLSTELNNQRMLAMATNTGIALEFGLNSTEEEMAKFKADYDTLSAHLGEFVNLNSSDVSITTFDTVYAFPERVGIVVNQNNVSTDEQFLLEAKQSRKVKVFGTTTKGGLDVSNLNICYTPKRDYVLVYALSKSLRIPGLSIDDIGVQPDIYIDRGIPEHEWISFIQDILNH